MLVFVSNERLRISDFIMPVPPIQAQNSLRYELLCHILCYGLRHQHQCERVRDRKIGLP